LTHERSARRRLDVVLVDLSISYELRGANDTAKETLREETKRLGASLDENGKAWAKSVERNFAEKVGGRAQKDR
jgi:hypothetical protein